MDAGVELLPPGVVERAAVGRSILSFPIPLIDRKQGFNTMLRAGLAMHAVLVHVARRLSRLRRDISEMVQLNRNGKVE
jgi:hypothetical protein